ncbi:hypothetical protein MF672_010685 [Actinomadura sp. ATCC 31491]|uniref:Uncharacterized protein n=1 Tax=Actinomadura luzonensis TaxID=2805427 RepID=A0ABT0FPL6_9ACTN|nr:hypothetical protein [Actinomadura luzonensis]MCK2214252.1 hypothetical protein [Actinomadura luzonensis]
MSDQLLEDVLTAVRVALDIPAGAGSDAARTRAKIVASRARRALPVVEACLTGSPDVAKRLEELTSWLAEHPPYGYVTVFDRAAMMAGQGEGECALPVQDLPPKIGVYALARAWMLNWRTLQFWVDAGMIPSTRGHSNNRVISRASAVEFARNATRIRVLQPGARVRHPQWHEAQPVEIVTVTPDGAKMAVVYRTPDGEVHHPPPCSPDRIVLRASRTPR